VKLTLFDSLFGKLFDTMFGRDLITESNLGSLRSAATPTLHNWPHRPRLHGVWQLRHGFIDLRWSGLHG